MSEIEHELKAYQDKFAGKIVFCNCDDFFESNFSKYFFDQFQQVVIDFLQAVTRRFHSAVKVVYSLQGVDLINQGKDFGPTIGVLLADDGGILYCAISSPICRG